MVCKFRVSVFVPIALFLLGVICFSASQAIYVSQHKSHGLVEPSFWVNFIDITGFALIVVSFVVFMIRPFCSVGRNRSARKNHRKYLNAERRGGCLNDASVIPADVAMSKERQRRNPD